MVNAIIILPVSVKFVLFLLTIQQFQRLKWFQKVNPKVESSVIVNIMETAKIKVSPMLAIAKDLFIIFWFNLFKYYYIFIPLITDIVAKNMVPKVVVLIPPAVEPGEPPININIIMIKAVVSCSIDMSTELNPAVLVITD